MLRSSSRLLTLTLSRPFLLSHPPVSSIPFFPSLTMSANMTSVSAKDACPRKS